MYKIKPPYRSFVNQEIYVKDNMEIKCGVVWGSTTIYVHPDSRLDFLKTYDPKVGINPFEIDGFENYENEDGKSVLFFSETTPEDEKNRLEEIFFGNSDEFDDSYEEVFIQLGWNLVDENTTVWGELDIEKVE